MPAIKSLGRHLIAELYGCPPQILRDVESVKQAMVEAAQQANATIVNITFHHFSPLGVSGVVVIQESHLAIHTWPEYQYASVDIYTCGDTVNPWTALNALEKRFKTQRISCIELSRGQSEQLPKPIALESPSTHFPKEFDKDSFTQDLWFTERAQHLALSVRHSGGLLHQEQSPHQKIEVYQTPAFGKMLVLNGSIALTQNDENAFHEMLVHVPLLSHPHPKRILVLGGGDGGAIREIVKHNQVETVVLVEVDKVVTEVCKQHFPTLSTALNNARVEIINQEGTTFLETCNETFDVVLIDTNDPLQAGEKPLLEEFYETLKKVVAKDGIVVTPIGSPFINPAIFRENFFMLKNAFPNKRVNHYLAFTPSYLTGMWSFAIIESKFHKNETDIEAFTETNDLRYYNLPIHNSAFHHPNFVKNILK